VSYATIYCVQTFRKQGSGVERDRLWSYGARADAEHRGDLVRGSVAGMAIYAVELDSAIRQVGRIKFLERYGRLPPYQI